MDQELLKRIEAFRKQKNLPILTLCKMMDVHNVTYHRWKNAGKITGAYHKIVEDFLAKSDKSSLAKTSDIAIIGIACHYPGASNVRELWENILGRRVQFRRMLDGRLPLSDYYNEDPKFPDKTYLTKAAFLENFHFDWGKLRIPRKTVESTDIAHWLALDIALKTFEDAGYKLNEIPLQNTGVIVGNTLTGEQTRSQTLRLRWPYVQKVLNATLGALGKSIEERSQVASEMEKIYKSAFYPVTEDSLAGGLANTIAGRICNYLNLKGGGYIVDGACSSSLLAVATAADALKMGNMDLALAGGVDISLDPFELVGFAKAGALAKDQMRVYDQKANGFLPGEGCGFVLLKRLKDAIRDKNYVYAVIKGWGISSDGKGGIMEPSSSGQSFAIGRAYKDLEYKICDVDFVEGHGTGTTKGDRVELEGIATAIDKTIKRKDKNKRGCGITSFKSIVGHTKAAAGVGGLIKAVMAVNQRILPPTATCTQPNDVFKDKAKNLYPIILGGRLAQDKKARAGISSAGFGGINCHITVESKDEPKKELRSKLDERALFVSHQETEVFVFTSRTITHLKKIIQKFKEDLRNISIAEMPDLAALLNKKVKNRLPIKAAIVTDSPEHLYEALVLLENEIGQFQVEEGAIHKIKTKDPATHIILSNRTGKSRIGFLYPGQGSQRLNMTRTLVHRYRWARDLFRLSELPLFEKVYQATDKFLIKEEQQEFEKQLSDTRITQPAVVLSSLIWTEFLSKLGIEPQCAAGHSLGELTAFYKGGAFNKETLVKFAQLRGELMASDGRSSGSMVSLSCSKNKVEEMTAKVSGNIVIANINSPHQIVVSGGKREIEKIKELAKKENVPAYPLNVSNAFHSSFMKEASDKIQKTKILPDKFKSNDIKVYSCMSGSAVKAQINLKEYFSKQMISPVNFVGGIESISKECDLMIEVGPGRVLTDLVKAINKEVVCLPVESFVGNDRDLNIILAEIFVRNVPVKWEELYKDRLIRTFVPASRKKFIENQCERPLKMGKHVLKNKFLPVLLQVKEEADRSEEIIPGGLPELVGKDKVADLLMELTHEITGFDRESITLNLRLLDDLNLDSIKAAELIGKAARTLGIAGQVDPSALSNNTLGQIHDRLNELVDAVKTGLVKESVSDILKRYHDKTWVRDFVLDLRPEEIKTKNVNQLKALKNIVFFAGKNEESLVKKLENEFKITKAKTQKSSRIDCLIAILPVLTRHSERSEESQQFNRDFLKSIIEQLHQVTDLAASNRLDKDSFVVFVQFGGGARSIASTLFLERPDLKVRVIDFDPKSDEDKISQKIIDELQTYGSFSAVGYDSQLTRRVVYYENSHPADYKKRGISWSGKDLVLVTGGAKGITAQCALEFARLTKAQMVLIGRSPLPEDKKDVTNEIIRTLKQFKNENLKCSYYQCDVTNEKDVVSTIGEIEKKAGKITGFIHGAGLNSLKRLKQASVAQAHQEALPKVIGAVNICNALKDHPPKLIVGITSIIGLTGMEGSGWYGFSNEMLDLYLHQFKNVVTIAYSIWDEVGMGAKLGSIDRLAQKGIGAIPVKEGIKHFKQLVEGDPGTQQVIVAARVAGIATWKSTELKANNFRFLEKVEYVLPGVELIAQANLNIEDDPYLLDHNWKGSLLFPFVFGFEAMAQAVAYVLGIEKFDYIKARDINLQRPIPVPQEAGTTIEIHAQVLERENSKGHQEVKVEVYSQDTAYKEPHFSAIFDVIPDKLFVIPAKAGIQQRAKNAIDLDMQTDIYGPILFQGKLFQCIEQIHELYYDEGTKKGECVFTSAYNRSAEEFLKKNKKFNKRFLIGDPFFIDSMLQSMQIIIPQDICLPNFIGEIQISTKLKDKEFIPTSSEIKQIDAEHYRGDGKGYGEDRELFIIRNCILKVLESLPDNPKAKDIVNPNSRDQLIFKDLVMKYERELGVQFPFIALIHIEGLKGITKENRHKKETPFLNKAIQDYFKINEKSVKYKIKWQSNGKPFLEVYPKVEAHLSITHERNLVLCSIGDKEQAIDIQTILSKTREDWLSLLGEKKFNIIKDFKDESLDYIGTAIWTSSEAYVKTGIKLNSQDIRIEKFVDKSHYIFGKGEDLFISIVVRFSRGSEKILTFLLKEHGLYNEPELNDQLGYGDQYFHFYADFSGPQQKLITSKKFPVTFKHSKSTSKRVNFSSYCEWMGEIREFALLSILKQLADIVETKEWGVATNNIKLDIKGELRGGDIVEGRVWLGNKINENVYDLHFEFWKHIDEHNKELIALALQRISWVKVLDHGKAKVNKLPLFLKDIMQKMGPRSGVDSSVELFRELYTKGDFGQGELIKNYERERIFLTEMKIPTSLEESNLVGNIYFANYPIWIGRTTDSYFYKLWPDLYTSNEINCEFLCKKFSIDHLNEAMPFDLINVKMFLSKLYSNAIIIEYEIYVNNVKKLAVARQSLLWVKRNNFFEPSTTDLPFRLLNVITRQKLNYV